MRSQECSGQCRYAMGWRHALRMWSVALLALAIVVMTGCGSSSRSLSERLEAESKARGAEVRKLVPQVSAKSKEIEEANTEVAGAKAALKVAQRELREARSGEAEVIRAEAKVAEAERKLREAAGTTRK